jgi:hypothetical protein
MAAGRPRAFKGYNNLTAGLRALEVMILVPVHRAAVPSFFEISVLLHGYSESIGRASKLLRVPALMWRDTPCCFSAISTNTRVLWDPRPPRESA